uniref:Xylanase inhibitor C-terminal domain-containing protein n=1 Tax=Leersia perrieri TaxID=77586 RepID=A0A0D9XJ77_9ORYZ
MAKISALVILLLFLFLSVATESSTVRSPVAAVETNDDEEEERAIHVKNLERIREIVSGFPDRLEKILDKFFPSQDGKDTLLQGNVSLSKFAGDGERVVVFSGEDDTVYACTPGVKSGSSRGGGKYAIIGLGRGSIIANSSRKFSYLISNDLRRSFVWLGDDAAAPAGQRGQKTTTAAATTKLIPVANISPDMFPSLYYINITGINVGEGELTGNAAAAATAILTTTMPFTFLNPSLFDDLKQYLRTTAAAREVTSSDIDGQLCYPKGTKLPAITLSFASGAGAAMMKVEAERYSYEKSDGVVCLSILRSPLRGGFSVFGSMIQAGRRVAYDLDGGTVTFDSEAAAAHSPQLTSPASSRSSSAAMSAPVVFLISSALMPLLLANIM